MSQVLQLNGLEYRYPGQSYPFLQVPSFSLQAGERVLLHGPSGCGKSTLLSLITGIRPVQQGEIRVAGQAFSSLPQRHRDAFRAAHMGIIFQAFNLLPYLSAVDNVCLNARFSRRRCEREGARNQTQRREAAQALLARLGLAPELIIADEPTSALDSASRDALLALLCELCDQSGSALLMVSHDSQVAGYFQRSVAFGRLAGRT